ncbi:MAG: transglutaminase family protein [Clostridia bacterium]|nr:transglutaminase family protein [Clostridia bacterium]
MIRRLGFSFQLGLTFSSPVYCHRFTLRCMPQTTPLQKPEGVSISLEPFCPYWIAEDYSGLKLLGFVKDEHTALQLTVSGTVANEDPEKGLPLLSGEPLGAFALQTPLTAPGPAMQALSSMLPDVSDAGTMAPAVMDLLAERFRYTPGATESGTTAEAAAAALRGVCQDEAHIMLSLLRLRGIPCRYVVGFMAGEGASHAWVELLLDGRWQGYDPTNHRMITSDYIRVSHGRDANDCPLNRGLFTGTAVQSGSSTAQVWEV